MFRQPIRGQWRDILAHILHLTFCRGSKCHIVHSALYWNIGLLEWTRWHFDTLVKSHCRMWASISLHCWLIGHLDITHTQYKGHNSSSSWDNNPQTWYVVIFFLSDPMRAVMYVQDGMFTPCKISMKYVSKYISSFLSYWLSGHHHYPI